MRINNNTNNSNHSEDSKDSNSNRVVNLCISHLVTLSNDNRKERLVVLDLRICLMKGKTSSSFTTLYTRQLFFERARDRRRFKVGQQAAE